MKKYREVRVGRLFISKMFCFGMWGILVLLIAQFSCSIPNTVPTNTPTPVISTNTPSITPSPTINGDTYYVDGTNGNDENPGTKSQPWQSIKKALDNADAGDAVIVRGGEYSSPGGGWVFQKSGTPSQPITFTNYPGEQVVLKISNAASNSHNIFRCSINPHNPESWQTPKADHIKIIGANVSAHVLSNGVESSKGLIMQGLEGEQSSAIIASDCDYWEVAGVDFIETASGIFTEKNNWSSPEEHSTDHWYVHDNRVYNFYRESGMQFNGNFNVIENNEIYKVSDRLDTPYGCQMLNLLGNNNIVRGNILSRLGSTAECLGILFEWDISDANLIEENQISDVPIGIASQGGDGNIIQNNEIRASANTTGAGVQISSYDNRTDWPCNDYAGSGGSIEAMLPPDSPDHPDYQYYFTPRNCHSMNNQVINNRIIGFRNPWIMYPVIDDSNIFSNNTTTEP